MDIHERNNVRRRRIGIMMVMALAVCLFTFYFFFIQTTYGIFFNKQNQLQRKIAVVAAYAKSDTLDNRDELFRMVKDYSGSKECTGIFFGDLCTCHVEGCSKEYNISMAFTTKENIRLFSPVVIDGELEYHKQQVKETRKVVKHVARKTRGHRDTPEVSGSADSINKNSVIYVDSLVDVVKYGAIIPRSIAEYLFGKNVKAVGKTIEWYNGSGYCTEKVVCVYDDFPDYTNMKNCMYLYMKDDNVSCESTIWSYLIMYAKMNSANDIENLRSKVKEYEKVHYPVRNKTFYYEVNDPHGYDDTVKVKNDQAEISYEEETRDVNLIVSNLFDYNNSPSIVRKLWSEDKASYSSLLSAILTIFIAFFCLITIAITTVPSEIKSINTRIVIGTSVRSVWLMYVWRYVVIAFSAFVISMLTVVFLDAEAQRLVNVLTSTSISIPDNMHVVAITLIIALLMGVATGLYAAYMSTSLPMASVLKGKTSMTPRSIKIRNVLIVMQYASLITIIMIFTDYIICGFNVKGNADVWIIEHSIQALGAMMYFFFVCAFVIFVTLLCTLITEHQYMLRSIAVRKALGTTNTEIFFMQVKHYLKLLLIAYPIGLVVYCVVNYMLCGSLMMTLYVLTPQTLLLFYFVMSVIVIIPIALHAIFSKEMDITNALKTE